MHLTLTSWNIHRGVCNDGVRDAERFLAALAAEVWVAGTDLLVLEEADVDPPPHAGVLDPARVAALTGLRYLHQDRSRRLTSQSHGFLGLVVYAAPDIEVTSLHLIDLPGYVPRGAVVVEACRDGAPFRLVVTHLSLAQVLRIAQMRTLGQYLARCDARPTLLCGDLNEWRPWGGLALSPRVMGRRMLGPMARSFPVGRPILPLDRVLAEPPSRVETLTALDGPGIRATSDHRPVRATVRLC